MSLDSNEILSDITAGISAAVSQCRITTDLKKPASNISLMK